MKTLLFLTDELPFARNSGAKLRNYYLLQLLKKVYHVEIVCITNNSLDNGKQEVIGDFTVTYFSIPRQSLLQKIRNKMRPFFLGRYAPAVQSHLESSKPSASVVWISKINMARYIPLAKKSGYKVIFDDHNIEFLAYESLLNSNLKKIMYSSILYQYKKQEILAWKISDRVVLTSSEDQKAFQKNCPIRSSIVLPNTIDVDYYAQSPQENVCEKQTSNSDLLFFGSLDYFPNIDAVHWLIDEIKPKLAIENKIHIAGAKASDRLKNKILTNNLYFYDSPASLIPIIQRASIIIVPLRQGGGTRLKIIESLACGKAIVSTRKGAEGLGLIDGESILYAETADEFITAIHKLQENGNLKKKLEENAKQIARENFDYRNYQDLVASQLFL